MLTRCRDERHEASIRRSNGRHHKPSERVAKDQFARIVMSPVAGIESNKHLLVLLVTPVKLAAPPAAAVAAPRKGARK